MSMEKLYFDLNFPEKTFVNLKLDKKFFLENKDIDNDFKDIFNLYVESIKIKYCLKGNILTIPSKQVNGIDYSEIEIIEIDINNNQAIYDIAKVIGRCIPYPLVIFFTKNDKFKICTYKIRENKSNNLKNVIEDIVSTGWFNKNFYLGRLKLIMSELNYNKLSHNNIHSMFFNIYNIVNKHSAKYIFINDVINLFNLLKDVPKSKEMLINECEYILMENNENNKSYFYTISKMDKYKRKFNYHNVNFCEDQIYEFLYKYKNIYFKNYGNFKRLLKIYEENKKTKHLLKEKKNKWECCYYDGRMCLNGNTIFFKYNCMEAKNCNFFKKNSNTKRYDNYKTDVTKMLKYGSVNKCKEKLNSNVKEVVE